MVQPQPYGGSSFHWEMAGEEAVVTGSQGSLMNSSQGSLRVPPELAGNEVVHRLLVDNHQLREALKRSNDALKDRCEEIEGWRQRSREEREFLSCKFREARSLVERLAEENQSLLGKLNHSGDQMAGQRTGNYPELGSKNQNQKSSCKDGRELTDPTEAMQKNDTQDETDRPGMPRSLPNEGSNEFLRLLKSHKEKLDEGMKELRRKNEELEKEKIEHEKEKKGLLSTIEQLHSKLTQSNLTVAVTEDAVQKQNAYTVSPERYKELQEKLNVLQRISTQRDRLEVLLKQKETECMQLNKDCEALRAQATSLLGELQERQTCLKKCEEERRSAEEKLGSKLEDLQTLQHKMEQEKKQHSVAVDKLLMQTQNLETALKKERLVTVDERRKLAQLQHAYTCLFQDYDKLKTKPGEMETLINRLDEAEKALALKQGHIDKLKEEVEQLRALQETNEVLTAQAEIYKSDFHAERRAREELNQKKEELQEKLNQALAEINLHKQEKMQQRHVDSYRPLPHIQPPAISQPTPNPPEGQPDYVCPKCRYVAPDMDTLQIHVMDCIQ